MEKTRLALVRSLISRYRSFDPDGKAGSVGDLIRLLNLEKELLESHQVVKEIKVTWVTPSKTESGT